MRSTHTFYLTNSTCTFGITSSVHQHAWSQIKTKVVAIRSKNQNLHLTMGENVNLVEAPTLETFGNVACDQVRVHTGCARRISRGATLLRCLSFSFAKECECSHSQHILYADIARYIDATDLLSRTAVINITDLEALYYLGEQFAVISLKPVNNIPITLQRGITRLNVTLRLPVDSLC
jgi:hypothetical protein